jgi:hypothetical protein
MTRWTNWKNKEERLALLGIGLLGSMMHSVENDTMVTNEIIHAH